MIKMKLKKKRMYNPHFPNVIECSNYQLLNDIHTSQVIVQRRRNKRTFLQPLKHSQQFKLTEKEIQIKRMAEYILSMKRKGLRYEI